MSGLTRKLGAALVGALVMVALPLSANAQERVWNVDVQAGYELSVQDLADMSDPGPAFGLSIGRMVHDQVSIRVGGNYTLLQGENDIPFVAEGPGMNLFRYYADVEANIFDPQLTDWKMLLSAGVGGALLNSDDFSGGHSLGEHWPMTRLGVKAAHPIGDRVDAYLAAEANWIYMDNDSEDMKELQRLHPHKLQPLDSSWTFPVSAGLRIHF